MYWVDRPIESINRAVDRGYFIEITALWVSEIGRLWHSFPTDTKLSHRNHT